MEFTDILRGMNRIGEDLAQEEDLYAAELADRQKKRLSGQAALDHYNEWMERCGRPDLKVEHNAH